MLQTESIGNDSHGLVRARGHLSQDPIQYLACLPVTQTCADVTCLGSVWGRICHLMKILHHQTANCPRSRISFSCCSVRGGLPASAPCVCPLLTTSLPSSLAHASPCTLTCGMYPFTRGVFSGTRVRLAHEPLGSLFSQLALTLNYVG